MDKWPLAVAEFLVITSLTVLADRFLSTKTALVVFGIGIVLVLVIHREKFKEVQEWALANKSTVVISCTVVGAVIGFGCGLLITKKAEAQQTMTAQQTDNKPPNDKPAEKQPAKPATKGTAKPPAPKGGDSISVGSVTQGPGSITQIGGTGNTAIIGGTPARSMNKVSQDNLIPTLTSLVSPDAQPMVAIRVTETTKEPQEFSGQIAYAFQQAGWTLRYNPGTESRLNINGRALSSGVYCQGQQSNHVVSDAVNALQAAGIKCEVMDMPVRDDGTVVTLRIIVGRNE